VEALVPFRIKVTVLIILLQYVGFSTADCAGKGGQPQGENSMTSKTIAEALKLHTERLMSLPGVAGVAQGLCDERPCIKVYVLKKTPELDKKIPRTLEGYELVVEETGEIRALPENGSEH